MANPRQPKVTRSLTLIQTLMGIGAHAAIALPYLRRVHGLENLDPHRRCLFVSNHVSLLDTILLGALFWRSHCYPVITLGDRAVWNASLLKRLLSRHIGFLVERGRMNTRRVEELKSFGRAGSEFHLLVFPEGTRGDGIKVGPCRPGVHIIAQEAKMPIVPIFIENMQLVSTKTGRFLPIGGLRKVEVHVGTAIPTGEYLPLEREAFADFIRESIASLRPETAASTRHETAITQPAAGEFRS